jgi:hypothetical protein
MVYSWCGFPFQIDAVGMLRPSFRAFIVVQSKNIGRAKEAMQGGKVPGERSFYRAEISDSNTAQQELRWGLDVFFLAFCKAFCVF